MDDDTLSVIRSFEYGSHIFCSCEIQFDFSKRSNIEHAMNAMQEKQTLFQENRINQMQTHRRCC